MYEIIANTQYGEEKIESEIATLSEARELLAEYRTAYAGMGFALKIRRERG